MEEEKTYCSDQEALYIVKYFYLTNKLMIHCELPIPCLCSEEKHLIVPGHRPDGPELMVMMTCIGHMAFWACNTHWTPLFQAKTAPHFWERLTGSSSVHTSCCNQMTSSLIWKSTVNWYIQHCTGWFINAHPTPPQRKKTKKQRKNRVSQLPHPQKKEF